MQLGLGGASVVLFWFFLREQSTSPVSPSQSIINRDDQNSFKYRHRVNKTRYPSPIKEKLGNWISSNWFSCFFDILFRWIATISIRWPRSSISTLCLCTSGVFYKNKNERSPQKKRTRDDFWMDEIKKIGDVATPSTPIII